jgi:hypothetical protein
MAARIAPARRKPAQVKAGERRAVQRRVRQAILATMTQAVTAVVEAAVQREVTELLGRERYTRRMTAGGQPTRAARFTIRPAARTSVGSQLRPGAPDRGPSHPAA